MTANGPHWAAVMTEPMLQWFKYEHLPKYHRAVSRPLCELAADVVDTLPRTPERTVALRKLLEAKDAAVRCAVAATAAPNQPGAEARRPMSHPVPEQKDLP